MRWVDRSFARWTRDVQRLVSMLKILRNNGDKRSGIDRRKFSFHFHIPERRSGTERRNGFDRRQKTKNIRLIKTK
jgi:hypothetical protein